ncbi:hypothetical protein ACIBU0_08800 [Streptomyces sp. NPDC049627]|uniref:hypothetical protein n=1 Tax=Streptomyces sp. NPDC049627 TaxID=3365595 RepID=UPI00378ABCC8
MPQMTSSLRPHSRYAEHVCGLRVFWIRDLADNLATEMKGAAADAGSWAVFSGPRDEFDGKGVCGSPEGIHGIVERGREQADNDAPKPSMQSFHPKPAGARLYANALEQTLQGR